MTEWSCSTTLDALSLALQKVAVARHPSPGSPLSGTRLHVLGQSLHLTATDDNARGAIYHLDVRGQQGFWGVAPASLLPDLTGTFGPTEGIDIGTAGDRLVARGQQGRTLTWLMGPSSAYTLGCFAGTGHGWRTVEQHHYWLRGDVTPVQTVVLAGRAIHQVYDSSTIFEETYDEYEEHLAEPEPEPVPVDVPAPAPLPAPPPAAKVDGPLRLPPLVAARSDEPLVAARPTAPLDVAPAPAPDAERRPDQVRERDVTTAEENR